MKQEFFLLSRWHHTRHTKKCFLYMHLLVDIVQRSCLFWGGISKIAERTITVFMSLRSLGTTGLPPNGLSSTLTFGFFFRKSAWRIRVLLKSDINNEYIREDLYIFVISRWVLIKNENEVCLRYKFYRKPLCSNTSFRQSRRLRDDVEKYSRTRHDVNDSIIRRMRIAYFISRATEYDIIIASPRRHW
jgi:hypothetical protein